MRDERAVNDMRIKNDRQIDSSDKRVTFTAPLQGNGPEAVLGQRNPHR